MTKPIKAYTVKNTGRMYKQCKLIKDGVYEQVYIPSEFAIQGKSVKIKRNGTWDDGWLVEEVWQEVDEAFLDAMRNALKHQREVSDV
jgi:hypothetical protein